jgi:magnesium-transporting ATPase (P-type)
MHDTVDGVPVDPSLVDAAAVATGLGVDPTTGLSAAEAAARLAQDGPNELRAKPPVPVWRKILAQFQNPLVYLLLVAIVISLVAWIAEGAHGAPVDAIVIAAIVIANAALGFVQENRAEDAVAALAVMTAANSTVLRDGVLATLPSSELVRGDILVLAEGDAVGADARLVTATGLKVQESSLTGESDATLKDPATLGEQAPVGDRFNMVFKGTAVVQGVGRAVVTGTGMRTEMGAIAHMLDETEAVETPLQKEIASVSRSLGLIVIGIAIVVMVAIAVRDGVDSPADLGPILLLGVSMAVAAVPEGLPAILSLTLAIGVRALAKRNAIMKNLYSVETLGSASVICSDKTGTLTRNEMTLRTVVTASGEVELTGTGYRPEGEAIPRGGAEDALLVEARRVLVGGVLANNAQLAEIDGEWQIQGDPTEAAFLVAQHKLEGTADRVDRYERQAEVPFTSERKMMSVLARDSAGEATRLFTKGAPDVLLARCQAIQVGTEAVALDEARRAATLADVERLSEQGYRTLGVAFRSIDVDGREMTGDLDESAERDLVYLGVVGIIDPPRAEASVAVSEAHGAGIRTIMITGDHPVTARRIASDLGIVGPDARAVTGAEIDRLDDEAFRATAREVSVFARVAPAHKLRLVSALQDDRHVVAMTGDGVNDAPALKKADIGVAMGITGTEVTKQAATMILADDNYATIVAAVHQGRVDRAAAGDPDPVDQPRDGLGPGAGDGRRPGDRRRHGQAAAPARGADHGSRDVDPDHVHRPRDGRGEPADDRHVPARRRRRRLGLARGRPHGRLHDPGLRAAVQRAELALRERQRVPRPVQQRVAVGRPGAGGRPAGARRPGPVPPGRLRYRLARFRPLGGSDRDGLDRPVGRGARQVGSSPPRCEYLSR